MQILQADRDDPGPKLLIIGGILDPFAVIVRRLSGVHKT